MIKPIIKLNDESQTWLSTPSIEVDIKQERAELTEIILSLKDTLRANDLVSLSAIHIGYNRRVFVINFNGKLTTFINPVITEAKAPRWVVYKTPAIPDKKYLVMLFDEIDLFYQTPLTEIKKIRLKKDAAYAFQVELNHLDGLIISDYGVEYDESIANLSVEEQEELYTYLTMRMKDLGINRDSVIEEIEKAAKEEVEVE